LYQVREDALYNSGASTVSLTGVQVPIMHG